MSKRNILLFVLDMLEAGTGVFPIIPSALAAPLM